MPSATHDKNAVFLETRGRLFAVAYRMLGSVSDAEDMLQDAFVRWQRADINSVRDPVGYLVRITTRLCLDQLRRVRTRRETYVGEWLPDPVVTSDPTDRLDHDVSVALLLALERLTPLERTAFLLHDVFDRPYEDIALTLERSVSTCRQLAARARRNVQQAQPRAPVDPISTSALVTAFFHAAKSGDTAALTQLLAQDVVVTSDGGGKVIAALNPILGRDRVIQLYCGLARKSGATMPDQWHICQLNGAPAIASYERGGILQTTTLDIKGDRITRIYVTRNPDKTRHLQQLFD